MSSLLAAILWCGLFSSSAFPAAAAAPPETRDPKPETGPAAAAAEEGYIPVEGGVRLHYERIGSGKQAIVAPMGSWLARPLAPLARADRTLIFEEGAAASEPTAALSRRAREAYDRGDRP